MVVPWSFGEGEDHKQGLILLRDRTFYDLKSENG